jgi:sigma-B regulation protein RsbU (phosphoserine phosphatase)
MKAPTDQSLTEHTNPSEQELVTTLFDLGRQVASVLDPDDLLHQIPRLIGRLISFEAFAVYLLDERRAGCHAKAVIRHLSGRAGSNSAKGLVGFAVEKEEPVRQRPDDRSRIRIRSGMNSEIAVPLMHKSRPTGALNILSRMRSLHAKRSPPSGSLGAHVAVAIVNARLRRPSRRDAEAFETLRGDWP